MSNAVINKPTSVLLCDFCGEEVTYYSEMHVRADIQKNNYRDRQNLITSKTKLVSWWREKRGVFGTDRYDFHGDCFVEMMGLLDKLKEANVLNGEKK